MKLNLESDFTHIKLEPSKVIEQCHSEANYDPLRRPAAVNEDKRRRPLKLICAPTNCSNEWRNLHFWVATSQDEGEAGHLGNKISFTRLLGGCGGKGGFFDTNYQARRKS